MATRKKKKKVIKPVNHFWAARWSDNDEIIGDPVPVLYKTKRLARNALYIRGATEIVRVLITVVSK